MNQTKIINYCGDISKRLSIIVLDEAGSTNDEVKSRAKDGSDWVVIARKQTAGRGRFGRSFDSQRGGLYLSLSFRPDRPPEQSLHLTALAALAICDAVRKLCNIKVEIKWPNDLLANGKKFCGILTEAVFSGGYFLVTGIGINLDNPLPPELAEATTLREACGFSPEPELLAAEVIKRTYQVFAEAYDKKPQLLQRYERSCATIGKKVRAAVDGTPVEGIAVGINENAALLVQKENGDIEAIFSGEATLKKD
ncbi:MAG: biotin--[acetyl-CoA-carboxylase] ligase [Oscillospiraceae bacterium]|jgi:BirA family biotin operon repressor/biotin-[acetyl-CoA-carboxylase] ligase